MLKKISIGFLVALLVTVGAVGIVLADDPEPTTDNCGPWCTRFSGLAEALGMDSEEIVDALKDGKTVAELAEEKGLELGDLVDALVNPRIATMKERMLERFESGEDLPFHGDRFSFDKSFGGRFGMMPRSGMGGMLGAGSDLLSEALGMTTDELMAALEDGTTISELAEAQGVPLETLVDTLAEAMAEQMSVMVESGHLTQEDLEAHIEQMKEMLQAQLESGAVWGGRFLGHREGCDEEVMGHESFRMPHGGMRGFHGGMRGYLPGADTDTQPSGFRSRLPGVTSL